MSARPVTQKIQQVDGLGIGDRNQRAGGEVIGQLLRDLAVNGFFGQGLIFKKLFEGAKGFVAVSGP